MCTYIAWTDQGNLPAVQMALRPSALSEVATGYSIFLVLLIYVLVVSLRMLMMTAY